MTETPKYTKKDFVSDQDVKWCPGCGDYAILSAVQLAMTKMNVKREDVVCISGIGCSSRFPYYMNTYGMHTIHGRAPAFATGLKVQNPSLSVWLITGDGDGLSIGGNHLIHAIRRNVNMNILLFNNEIYGLTKGQYSPTSKEGLVTKSTPYGSLDRSFSPGNLALGAGSTFYARTMDTDPKHMMEVFQAAQDHQGTSFIEIYQNCVIFNDGVHDAYTNKQTRDDTSVLLAHGEPMIYGKEKNMAIALDGFKVKTGVIGKDIKESEILKHDKYNQTLAFLLSSLKQPEAPIPMGVIYQTEHAPATYDEQVHKQIKMVSEKKGKKSMKDLLHSGEIWTVK
jgi:2-oxoglutarate/2-oxoacid ferredoxin oxidoreductase subunit beta